VCAGNRAKKRASGVSSSVDMRRALESKLQEFSRNDNRKKPAAAANRPRDAAPSGVPCHAAAPPL
jgi:hypothetical protein